VGHFQPSCVQMRFSRYYGMSIQSNRRCLGRLVDLAQKCPYEASAMDAVGDVALLTEWRENSETCGDS